MDRVGSIKTVTKEFPKEGAVRKTQNGFNFTYEGVNYCFFYNNGHMKMNKMCYLKKVVFFASGHELTCLNKAIADVHTVDKKMIPHMLPEEKREPSITNKAQLCIDHLIAKKEMVLNSKRTDNTRLLNMLTILIDELKQYR